MAEKIVLIREADGSITVEDSMGAMSIWDFKGIIDKDKQMMMALSEFLGMDTGEVLNL